MTEAIHYMYTFAITYAHTGTAGTALLLIPEFYTEEEMIGCVFAPLSPGTSPRSALSRPGGAAFTEARASSTRKKKQNSYRTAKLAPLINLPHYFR